MLHRDGLALLTALTVATGCAGHRDAPVYDGFESPQIGQQWESGKFLSGAVQTETSVVRAGERAARITLRPGDQVPGEEGSNLERAELLESRRLWSMEESGHEYSFSLLLPQDFPIVPTRLVIAQWKQDCPGASCTPDHPVVAIRYQDGRLAVTSADPESTRIKTDSGIRGRDSR